MVTSDVDAVVQQAREHHRRSHEHSRVAGLHRLQRDMLIRQIWRDSRDEWTYEKLAKAIGDGCSPELIAKIVKGETRERST